MDLDTLKGKTVLLYGADGNAFCLGIDGKRRVFEAMEDDEDGYRSMLSDVRELDGAEAARLVFSRRALAKVRVETGESRGGWVFDGWMFVDVDDGHRWLVVGTDNADDYYPSFTFTFEPKAA